MLSVLASHDCNNRGSVLGAESSCSFGRCSLLPEARLLHAMTGVSEGYYSYPYMRTLPFMNFKLFLKMGTAPNSEVFSVESGVRLGWETKRIVTSFFKFHFIFC